MFPFLFLFSFTYFFCYLIINLKWIVLLQINSYLLNKREMLNRQVSKAWTHFPLAIIQPSFINSKSPRDAELQKVWKVEESWNFIANCSVMGKLQALTVHMKKQNKTKKRLSASEFSVTVYMFLFIFLYQFCFKYVDGFVLSISLFLTKELVLFWFRSNPVLEWKHS